MLRDVVELRDNKWVPRREEHCNPIDYKTIDQIHKEAQMEKMPVKYNKQKEGGPGKVLVLVIWLVFLSGASPILRVDPQQIKNSFWSVSSRKPTVRTAQVLREVLEKLKTCLNILFFSILGSQ